MKWSDHGMTLTAAVTEYATGAEGNLCTALQATLAFQQRWYFFKIVATKKYLPVT